MLRRDLLQYIASSTVIFFSGMLKPVFAKWNAAAFNANDLQTALASYFDQQPITMTKRINIQLHPVVENGAVVPIKVETDLPKPSSITVFVEKNPNPLVANFDLSPQSVGFISTRIKMDQSSQVIVIVQAQGKAFSNSTFVEVHQSGCS